MSTHTTTNFCNHNFKKGDEIEILRNADAGDVPVWFPATIIDSPSPSGTLHVKFKTLFVEKDGKKGKPKRKRIRDHVSVADGVTRPVPPAAVAESHRCFVAGEEVEAFHDGGWRRAVVKDVLMDWGYRVVVVGGAVEVVAENRNVRVFRNWKQTDGFWFPSTLDPQQGKSSQLVSQSPKRAKIRIKCSTNTSSFQKGTPVEVRSNEEGYYNSWFTATVMGSAGEDKHFVQYDTLTTDDEMQPLVEIACASNIRPIPPIINRIGRFKMLEEVDAWYNDGWWVGIVSKVLVGLKYVVYFWTTNDEHELEHTKLRSHQEFINEKWVASFLRPKLAAKHRLETVKLQTGGRTLMVGLLCGLKVEIAHGEGGYLSTWYPAVILGPVSIGKYLVEYRTVITNNGRNLVKEVVDVSCIRPCPPIIQRALAFQPNDKVDAWDVNGWRIGQICRTMRDFKYEVYLQARNTVIEFRHADLRPHQDFVDGAWLHAAAVLPNPQHLNEVLLEIVGHVKSPLRQHKEDE